MGRGLQTESHAHGDIGVFHHLGEFLEADLAIAVKVGLHDGLVDDLTRNMSAIWGAQRPPSNLAYLLQLLVLEVASDHHLEDNEQLTIADVAVTVNVVNLECEA